MDSEIWIVYNFHVSQNISLLFGFLNNLFVCRSFLVCRLYKNRFGTWAIACSWSGKEKRYHNNSHSNMVTNWERWEEQAYRGPSLDCGMLRPERRLGVLHSSSPAWLFQAQHFPRHSLAIYNFHLPGHFSTIPPKSLPYACASQNLTFSHCFLVRVHHQCISGWIIIKTWIKPVMPAF